MDIDEAGRHNAPGHVDSLSRGSGGEVSERRYAPAAHPDVGPTPG